MSLPDVVSREQWLEARRRLLAREKVHTRSRDTVNAERRRLPMVKVDQQYVFEGPDGPNITCWTISWRWPANRSASVTGPSGPSNT